MSRLLLVVSIVLIAGGLALPQLHGIRVRDMTRQLAELNDTREKLTGDYSLPDEEQQKRQAEYEKIESEYYERGISSYRWVKETERHKYYWFAGFALIGAGLVAYVIARTRKPPRREGSPST